MLGGINCTPSECLLQSVPSPQPIKMPSALLQAEPLPSYLLLQAKHLASHPLLQAEPLPSYPASLKPQLRDRPWSASTHSPLVPESLDFISEEDVDCYRLVDDTTAEEAGNAIKQLVDKKLEDKGAVLVRGLLPVFPTNKEFGMLVEKMGKAFSYSAGSASREHDPDAEGG